MHHSKQKEALADLSASASHRHLGWGILKVSPQLTSMDPTTLANFGEKKSSNTPVQAANQH
ncbi:MAG TPA: hypothetical protein VN156_01900 [Pseudomonas sp.]|nr:hypothetical protein [Pseudomonas sp.]